MRDQADRILMEVKKESYEFDKLDDHQLMGILTLENVIEFILKMDIKDEKDLERAELQKSLGKNHRDLMKHKTGLKNSNDNSFAEAITG